MRAQGELQSLLGYYFSQPEHLRRALTHKSTDPIKSNERLEYLGDAVLDLVVGEWLFRENPSFDEGALTKVRAALVNAKALAEWAEQLQLDRFINTSRHDDGKGMSARLLSSGFEAIVGALFLDSNYETVKRVLQPFLDEVRVQRLEQSYDDKSKFQEVAQARWKKTPTYRIVDESGPAHNRYFRAEVLVGDEVMGFGQGNSKREAEKTAAKSALEKIDE